MAMERIDPDHLYDERGTVGYGRPIFQGDVYDRIELPFYDSLVMVQVVGHPCAIRRGTELAERIIVAPIMRSKAITGSGWDGNIKLMPLADLCEDGEHWATHFPDITALPREFLSPDKRVASLSNRGILVLQQRLIKHYTRLVVDIAALQAKSEPVLIEAEMERDWIDAILGAACDDVDAITQQSSAFDEWMREGDPDRRNRLQDEINHTDIRRQSRREAARRAAATATA
jgi:hypothetical protein